jgi:polysaccharide export outer membrane protein
MDRRFIATLLAVFAQLAYSQTGPTTGAHSLPATITLGHPAASADISNPSASRTSYVLGPNDLLTLVVPQLGEDFADKSFRIDANGDLSLPVIGRVHAAGLTEAELEDLVKDRFSAILKAPDIVVNVSEYSGQPVSVLGAVNQPGIKQLQGGKTLFEVLSLAGGLRPEAGTTIEITRDLKNGMIPLAGAVISANGQYSVATVRIKEVMKASQENILLRPGDTVFVPKADVVYVVGSVTKPGGFPIGENEILSALQVVSLAEGMVKTAAGDKAKILRLPPGSTVRTEIPINLKSLMAGKAPDVTLQANDILFVPNSNAKSAGYRTMEAIVNAATGMAMYGRY